MMRDGRLDDLSHEDRLKLLESQGAFQYGREAEQSVEILGQLQILCKHLDRIRRLMGILTVAAIVYVVISLLSFLVHL
jgi:hypothetical protein